MYHYNPFARALPTGRTQILGLVVADLTNPIFFDVLRGAERTGVKRKYTLVVADAFESEIVAVSAVERLTPFVDGLILVTSRFTDAQIAAIATRKPVVTLNRMVPEVPAIVPNIAVGIQSALEHLSLLGHHSLAFLSAPTQSCSPG